MSLLKQGTSEAKKEVKAVSVTKQTKELSKWPQTLSCRLWAEGWWWSWFSFGPSFLILDEFFDSLETSSMELLCLILCLFPVGQALEWLWVKPFCKESGCNKKVLGMVQNLESPQQPVAIAELETGFPSKLVVPLPAFSQAVLKVPGGQGELRRRSVLQVFARAVGGEGCWREEQNQLCHFWDSPGSARGDIPPEGVRLTLALLCWRVSVMLDSFASLHVQRSLYPSIL